MKNYKSKKTQRKEAVLKKKKFLYLTAPLLLIPLFYSYDCFFEKTCGVNIINKIVRHHTDITTPNGVIDAEVVDTKSSREPGLSGRSGMKDNYGMLFKFDVPGKYGFWMKDMKFPLDILWINKNGVVVAIESNFTPESYLEKPPKTAVNSPSASYVLEINAGRAEELGLFLGTKVKIGE
jgi:uncharacterized membrane protein (UPF0127 family)